MLAMTQFTRNFQGFIAGGLLSLLVLSYGAASARAQSALKVINPPQGGRAVYGQIPGESTEAQAMGWLLRSLHQEFGDRPSVGKLFQVHGTESVAAFFSLTNRVNGNAQLTGLMIVTKTATDHVEGAVLYDVASKFSSSCNPLMKALFNEWHPFDSAGAAAGGHAGSGPAPAIPPMHRVAPQDNSASVELPDGWKIMPSSGGGTMGAVGPNGENVFLGLANSGMDTRNPNVQRTMRTLQQGGLQNTSYAKAQYFAWDSALDKMFVDTMQYNRKIRNQPPASIQIESQTPVQAGPSHRCVHITGKVDRQDGQGSRQLDAIFSIGPTARFGNFGINTSFTTVPAALADKERAMLGAILASYQVNQAVVQQEANAIAAPAIQAIHEVGKRAAMQAQAAHEANDIHNSSVYQRWDDQDKRSQAFENYQLGYSVVSDTGNNAHATMWNEDADRLVSQNPDRFEYVNTPNYWKGVDY
jgi:hypothetical protein